MVWNQSHRDQKKQIATICTALGTLLISGLLTALFGKGTSALNFTALITSAITLYFVAIITLN